MTTAQRIRAVQNVVKIHDAQSAEWDKFISLFGPGSHDCPLFEVSWKTFDAYMESVAREIGDECDSLAWFVMENDCGRKAMKAGLPNAMRPIRTAKDLVALIAAKL